MQIFVKPKRINHINPTPVLQQTAFWARVKQKQGYRIIAFDIKASFSPPEGSSQVQTNEFRDDIIIVVQPVSREHYIAYIPYGPVKQPDEELMGPYLEELSESLRSFLPGGCLSIRYDLSWESPWNENEDHTSQDRYWQGPPNPSIQEMRFNISTKKQNLCKSVSGVLPSDTVFLDLQKSGKRILNRMKSKTRYNIRLSKRKGVRVRKGDEDDLPLWNELHKETARRNRIISEDPDYFRSVLQTKAKDSRSPGEVHMLLAEKEGIPLAGLFVTISGGRATYLYGASSSKMRNLMPTYALQWEAINLAKSKGCKEYDMFGISPERYPSNPLYGLYRFKTGFGGEIYHRTGCWDYPLEPEIYEAYRMAEMNAQGYHIH